MTTLIQQFNSQTPDVTPKSSNPRQEEKRLDIVAVQLNFVKRSVQRCVCSSKSRLSGVVTADLVIVTRSLNALEAGIEMDLLDEGSNDIDNHKACT